MKRCFHFVFAWTVLALAAQAGTQVSNLRRDERLLFYPACAWQARDSNSWNVEIHGCVYEPESRGLALALLKKALEVKGVKVSATQEPLFSERARLFMVDNERAKEVVIRIGSRVHNLPKSEPNGHFSARIQLSGEDVAKLRSGSNGVIEFEAVLPPGDTRSFKGLIRFYPAAGWLVISDIDDTIKVSEVNNSQAILRNTFLEPFRPVEGMAGLYQAWEVEQAGFFYVSASPWQLYLPLSEFVRSNGFPEGVFSLKIFRLKDSTRLSVLEDPEEYKPKVIEPILRRFPECRFVLVGDSGERDPEIYAGLARKYPRQVARILIRNVTEQPAESPRYRAVFGGLPRGLWEVFEEPGTVRGVKGLN